MLEKITIYYETYECDIIKKEIIPKQGEKFYKSEGDKWKKTRKRETQKIIDKKNWKLEHCNLREKPFNKNTKEIIIVLAEIE